MARRWLPRGVRVLLLALVAMLSAPVLAISFTVQVIAVSDQESALSISRELLRDGYPTYVVRSTGAQGDVYRVRVGAFANRSAALRYAESMPEVGGSRPVPALAEAIPQGIMPLAPRLLWQTSWWNEDVRVLPWPGGVALRVQRGDPLRQASYVVFQDGEERRFEAWAALPLATLPEPTRPPELDVPMVDLTVPPRASPPVDEASEEEFEAPVTPDELPVEDDPGAEREPPESPEAAEASEAREPEDAPAVEDAPGPPSGVGEPVGDGAPAPVAVIDPLAPGLERLGVEIADPYQSSVEAGLLLLRDRWLWPPTWDEESDEVRTAFRRSLLALIARELELSEQELDALAYLPGGEPPPAVVVLDLSDPSARDAGRVAAIGDISSGIGPFGPPRLVPDESAWVLPGWPQTRIRRDAPAPDGAIGGSAWSVVADDGFVRITLPDGATWRAGVGVPLWSDGRVVLAWDGDHLLLYDFVPR
jgi:hypothetical protein